MTGLRSRCRNTTSGRPRRAARGYCRYMPVEMEEQILSVLRGMKAGDRPITFGELARRFGVSYDAISRYARNLVDGGLAETSMIRVRGSMTPHGLLPQPAAPQPAAPAAT